MNSKGGTECEKEEEKQWVVGRLLQMVGARIEKKRQPEVECIIVIQQ